MALVTELHVQAGLWEQHAWRIPVLYLEGEAPDHAHDTMVDDALLTVARARGLPLTTDPGYLPLRPVPGWRLHADDDAITIDWPHFKPLLAAAPVELPDGWQHAATAIGAVVLFAGHGLGLHDPHDDGNGHASTRLWDAAAAGAVAGGTVALADHEARAADLDGILARPRSRVRHHHRPASSRWWARSAQRRWSGHRPARHRTG